MSVLDRTIAARRDDKTNATERRISIGGDDDAVRGAARDECELAIDDRIIGREVRREVHGDDRREIEVHCPNNSLVYGLRDHGELVAEPRRGALHAYSVDG